MIACSNFSISLSIEIVEAKTFDKKDNIILVEDVQFLNIIKHNYSYDPTQKKWYFSFEHISKLIGEKFFENKPKVDLKVGIKISYFIKYSCLFMIIFIYAMRII